MTVFLPWLSANKYVMISHRTLLSRRTIWLDTINDSMFMRMFRIILAYPHHKSFLFFLSLYPNICSNIFSSFTANRHVLSEDCDDLSGEEQGDRKPVPLRFQEENRGIPIILFPTCKSHDFTPNVPNLWHKWFDFHSFSHQHDACLMYEHKFLIFYQCVISPKFPLSLSNIRTLK